MTPRSNAVPDVLLKEYVNAAAAQDGGRRGHGVPDAVRRPERQYHRPDLGRPGPRRGVRSRVHTGGAAGRRTSPARPWRAVASAAAGSLWTAQAWGPGGLQKLADPARERARAGRAEVVAPRAEGARRGFGTRACASRATPPRGSCGAWRRFTARGVAHGAIDASAFAANTLEDAERGRARGAPDELRVRVCVDGGIEAERPARRRGDGDDLRRTRVLGARPRGGPAGARVARALAGSSRTCFCWTKRRRGNTSRRTRRSARWWSSSTTGTGRATGGQLADVEKPARGPRGMEAGDARRLRARGERSIA